MQKNANILFKCVSIIASTWNFFPWIQSALMRRYPQQILRREIRNSLLFECIFREEICSVGGCCERDKHKLILKAIVLCLGDVHCVCCRLSQNKISRCLLMVAMAMVMAVGGINWLFSFQHERKATSKREIGTCCAQTVTWHDGRSLHCSHEFFCSTREMRASTRPPTLAFISDDWLCCRLFDAILLAWQTTMSCIVCACTHIHVGKELKIRVKIAVFKLKSVVIYGAWYCLLNCHTHESSGSGDSSRSSRLCI